MINQMKRKISKKILWILSHSLIIKKDNNDTLQVVARESGNLFSLE